MVTILDHCSRYTIECSLFLHERTQVAGDFLMDELFERKKKKKQNQIPIIQSINISLLSIIFSFNFKKILRTKY